MQYSINKRRIYSRGRKNLQPFEEIKMFMNKCCERLPPLLWNHREFTPYICQTVLSLAEKSFQEAPLRGGVASLAEAIALNTSSGKRELKKFKLLVVLGFPSAVIRTWQLSKDTAWVLFSLRRDTLALDSCLKLPPLLYFPCIVTHSYSTVF